MSKAQKIRFVTGQASGYDELAGANSVFINAIPEGDGFRVRPGLDATASPLPSTYISSAQIEAMAAFQGSIVYVTSGREIFALDQDGTNRNLSITGGASLLAGSSKPTIYASGGYCLIAGGAIPQQVTSDWVSRRLATSGETAPPDATGITMNTQRIVAIASNTDEFYWSGLIPTGVDSWDTDIEYDSAQARPDYNVAIAGTANEVWIWGETTIQLFQPDEQWTYTPIISTDVGCAAQRSVVKVENRFAWLDDKIRFQLSDGRTFSDETDISRPIKSTIEELATVDDCWGFRARIRQHDLLVWNFPTVGRTFCYDLGQGAWSEIRGWRNGRWQAWYPTAYCWWPEKRMHVVGLSDGTLAELSFDASTDIGDTIPWRVRTGFQDHGTQKRKTASELVLQTRPVGSEEARIVVSWRDRLDAFSQPVVAEGYSAHDSVPTVVPCGEPYRSRQYEFSGQADTVSYVASATEELQVEGD